jgi:TetR/AcrR family transcriptional regulator, cholesterol catabolism regulator
MPVAEDRYGGTVTAAARRRGPQADIALTDRRRGDILREAARLFDQVGYHGVNMEMIAEAAGLKKPTLYHYIRSKDEILFGIQEQMIAALHAGLTHRIDEGRNTVHLLQGVFEDIFRALHDRPGVVRSFFEQSLELTPESRAEISRRRSAFTSDVMQVIRQGMETGALRRSDVRLTTLCFFGVCNWAYQWYQPRATEPDTVARKCFAMFASGIGADAAEDGR